MIIVIYKKKCNNSRCLWPKNCIHINIQCQFVHSVYQSGYSTFTFTFSLFFSLWGKNFFAFICFVHLMFVDYITHKCWVLTIIAFPQGMFSYIALWLSVCAGESFGYSLFSKLSPTPQAYPVDLPCYCLFYIPRKTCFQF